MYLDIRSAKWISKSASPDTMDTNDFEYNIEKGARRYETWERPIALWLGQGEAARCALDVGIEWSWNRVQSLGAELRHRLAAVPRVQLADRGDTLCGIVTFAVEGVGARALVRSLRSAGINTSVSTQGSTRLDMQRRSLLEIVRASPHYFNSDEDLAALVRAVERIQGSAE